MGKKVEPRITIDALKYYVPIFQMGDEALDRLYEEGLTVADKNRLEAIALLRDLATKKIAALSKPLMVREVNKILSGSHLRYIDDGLFDLLYYAGINGLMKGLRNFDTEKIRRSATNYLLQWFSTYANRELLVQEAAPFNIPPSRFAVYKKISAVRKRLSDELERDATNEEIHDFFQSGRAEVRSMSGPVGRKRARVSKANKRITVELIKEQEEYEQKFHYTHLIDPIEDFRTLSFEEEDPFIETLFGVFLEAYSFTPKAEIVLKSMLKITDEDEEKLFRMKKNEYKRFEESWYNLLRDKNGPFYEYLIKIHSEGFNEFGIVELITAIESSDIEVERIDYIHLIDEDEGD